MNEQLEIYTLDGTFLYNQDREEFYRDAKKEFSDVGAVSKKVKTVRVLVMNSLGRIYLQKRSESKIENANLYDKTIGGHVTVNNTFKLTVVKECAEELGFPATILSKKEFTQAVRTIDLKIIGLLYEVDEISDFESSRILKNGDKFVQPYISKMYIGYYDGPIRFTDGESCGVETFSIGQLRKEIVDKPDKFTEDIKFMINKYADLLVPIK